VGHGGGRQGGHAVNSFARLLSRFWLNRKASVAVLFDRPHGAIADLKRIVEIEPRNEVARAALGNLYAETNDPVGAVREFVELVELNPANAEAWFNLGYLYDQRDDLASAERCFRKAIELKPSIDRAWYGLGLVLVRAGRLREAIEAFRKNIKLQPFSPYGYYQLGMTYHHLGDAVEAERVHDELKKFEPKYAATLRRDLSRTPPQAVETSIAMQATKEETTVPHP
jgi:tetratricopeptide (TPR) repeat protein